MAENKGGEREARNAMGQMNGECACMRESESKGGGRSEGKRQGGLGQVNGGSGCMHDREGEGHGERCGGIGKGGKGSVNGVFHARDNEWLYKFECEQFECEHNSLVFS